MAGIGIKNSKQLFNKIRNKEEMYELAKRSDIPSKELLEILKLSDLVRTSEVGSVFARMIFDTVTDTTAKMSDSNAELLFKELSALNEEKIIQKQNLPRMMFILYKFRKKVTKGF